MGTINKYSSEEHANLFAQLLPGGKAMTAKFVPGSNLRKFIEGITIEQKRIFDLLCDFLEERDPRDTNIFIEEWESALGIPDDCIPMANTLDQRREYILLKLTSLSVQTEEDFIRLGETLGFTIRFGRPPGFPYTFPFQFGNDAGGFPYTFPFTFSDSTAYSIAIFGDFSSDPDKADVLQCLIRKLIPAYKNVTFIEG